MKQTLLGFAKVLIELAEQHGNLELKFTHPPSLKEASTSIAYLYNDTITIYQGYLCERVLSRTEFYWKYIHNKSGWFYLSDTKRYELLERLFKHNNVPLVAMFKRGEGKTTLSLLEIIYRLLNLKDQYIVYHTYDLETSKVFLKNIEFDLRGLRYNIRMQNSYSIELENGNRVEVRKWDDCRIGERKRPTFLIYDDVLATKHTKMWEERFIYHVLHYALPGLNPVEQGGGQLLILGTPTDDESYLVQFAQKEFVYSINTTDI